MKNQKKIKLILKDFNNNQLESTGHFGTFSTKNKMSKNTFYIPTYNNNNYNFRNIYTKYYRPFSETNPKALNYNNLNNNNNDIENSNLSIGDIKFLPNYFVDIQEALKNQIIIFVN